MFLLWDMTFRRWIGVGVVCLAQVVSAQTIITLSTNVIRADVDRLGINIDDNYWDGPTLTARAEFNFEGVIYRQAHQGELYTNGFVSYGLGTNELATYGWADVYTNGATFTVLTGEDKGATGRIVNIETKLVDIYGNGTWRHQPFFIFETPIPLAVEGVRDIGLLVEDFTRTTHGYMGETGGFWKTAGATISTNESAPGSFGVACARLDGFQNATIRLPTFHQRVGDVNGPWHLRFWARRESGAPSLTVGTHTGSYVTPTNIVLSDVWQQYDIELTASGIPTPPYPQSDTHMSFQLRSSGSGVVLLDDVEFWQGGQTNGTAFTDEAVNALRRLNPGIIRFLRMGGSTVYNAIVPKLRQYGTAFGLDVRPDVYAGSEGNFRKDTINIHEQAVLAMKLGANPWFCLPGAIHPEEVAFFVEYLGGDASTPGGQLRTELGQEQPWSEIFDRIYIEIGNEAWNGHWPYMLAGFNYGDYWQDLFMVGKASPAYTPNMLFQAAGQNWDTFMANRILTNTPAADGYAIAPYMIHGVSTNDLLATDELTHQWFLSYPLYRIFENGMPQQYAVSQNHGVEYTIYEYNYHMTDGLSTGPDDEATRDLRNAFLTSAAKGVSVGNSMLAMMRHYGIRAQNFFSLTQFEYQNTRLFGAAISFREDMERYRPSFLAMELINKAMQNNMIETIHSGDDPSYHITGNFGGSSHSTHTYKELYSYAFQDDDQFGLVIANYNLQTSRTVQIYFPMHVVLNQAEVHVLQSSAYTDHNEPDNATPAVTLVSDIQYDFTSGVTLEIPPSSIVAYTWQSAGINPSPMVSTHEISVPEGSTNSFEVWMGGEIMNTVTLSVVRVSGDTDLYVVSGEELVFTPENWNVPQTVTLGALEDFDTEDGVALFSVSGPGIVPVYVTAYVQDSTPPETIDDLAVASQTFESVTLQWTAPFDQGAGTEHYNIRYSTAPITEANFASAIPASSPPLPAAPGSTESFQITGLNAETLYYFAIKTTDGVGNISDLSNVASTTTDAAPVITEFWRILIDLGVSHRETAGNWNNVSSQTTGLKLTNMIETNGLVTAADLSITSAFANPPNSSGMWADDLYPSSAQSDSFYIGAGGQGEIQIENLDTNRLYQLTLFGSRSPRSGWNFMTRYTVNGHLVDHLDTQSNTSNTVVFADLEAPGGIITIQVEARHPNGANSTFGYLGVIDLVAYAINEPGELDADGDGIPDWWEELHFGGPTNAVASALAANEVNTLLEAYIADLNPTNPVSFFMIEGLTSTLTGNVLHWDAVEGRVYSVYWSTNLPGGAETFQLLQNGLVSGVFTNEFHADEERVFYRLGVELE